MRLDNSILSFIINFLLGIAWASVFIGAVSSSLSYYYSDGIVLAGISFFIGAIPGLIGVLLLEVLILQKEKHFELKKQTSLLEELVRNQEISHNEQVGDTSWSPNIPS